jgi:hypothetical protein
MLINHKTIIIKAIIFLSFFLITIEICARIEDAVRYNAPFFSNYTFENMLYTYDKYGKTGTPKGRFQKWRLNTYGFRGDEIELNKPPHVIRIACVGASETFGYHETSGGEWPAQLSEILNTYKNGYYSVINTALPGRRLRTNIIHVRERVLRFKPDIIILFPPGLHYMDPDFKINAKKQTNNIKTSAKQFSIHSRVKPKIRQCIKGFVPNNLRKSIARYEGMKKLYNTLKIKGYDPFVDEISSTQQQRFKKTLDDFYNLCIDHNIKLILGTIAYYLNEDNIIEAWRYYPYLTKKGFKEGVRIINQIIIEFSEEKQIPYVDISKLVPKNDLYMGDYIHFTDKGAKIVAQAFAIAVSNVDLQLDESM